MNSGSSSPLPASGGYASLLRRNVPFRRLFLARLASLGGDWFNTLAVLALLRELGETRAEDFALVLIAKVLPALFLAPLSGALVDRLERRWLLVGLDLIRCVLVLSVLGIPFLALHGEALGLQAWGLTPVRLLYLSVVLQAACAPIAEPARNAVVPDIVAREDLLLANALGAASWSLMFALGVSLGGLVTASAGWRVALVIDALTFLFSAWVIWATALPDHRHAESHSPDRDLLGGLRFLAARPRLLTLALAKAGWSLAGGVTLVLVTLGERTFTLGKAGIMGVSALWFARAIGTGCGPFAARAICGTDPRRAERVLAAAYLWGALCYLGLGYAAHLWVAMALVILAHLGGATVWVFSTVRLQALTPSGVRGRVFAAEQALWTLVMATSTWVFAQIIDQELLPLPRVVSALGYLLILPGLAWVARCAWLGDPPRDPL